MFSSRLRSSRTWSPLIPQLSSPRMFNLRESTLDPQDIVIPVRGTCATSSRPDVKSSSPFMSIVLLDSTYAQSGGPEFGTILERLRNCAALTGGRDVFAFFLLAKPAEGSTQARDDVKAPLHAYWRWQAITLEERLEGVRVVPVQKIGDLVKVLKGLLAAAVARERGQVRDSSADINCGERAVTDLLSMTSVAPPLSDHTTFVLTTIFRDIRALAEAASTAAGECQIIERLAAEGPVSAYEADGVVEFWKDDWIAE